MIKCGITGSKGNLGKSIIKQNKNFILLNLREILQKKTQ